LVFINFYADWCRFSNMLAPIWDEAADKINAEFQNMPGKVAVGKVDCDKESSLGSRFHITKYPTLKYVVNGEIAKREYRGKRDAEAFLKFVQEQTRDPVQRAGANEGPRSAGGKIGGPQRLGQQKEAHHRLL